MILTTKTLQRHHNCAKVLLCCFTYCSVALVKKHAKCMNCSWGKSPRVQHTRLHFHSTGKACSTYGGRGEVHAVFWWEHLREGKGLNSSVGIAARYGLGSPGIESRWGGEIFRTRPDRPWGPPSILHNGYRVFPGGKRGRGVALTTHPHLAPRLGNE
jgi:hypothetical protein